MYSFVNLCVYYILICSKHMIVNLIVWLKKLVHAHVTWSSKDMFLQPITYRCNVCFLHQMCVKSSPNISYLIFWRFTLVLMERCPKATMNLDMKTQPSYPHQPTCWIAKALTEVPSKLHHHDLECENHNYHILNHGDVLASMTS